MNNIQKEDKKHLMMVAVAVVILLSIMSIIGNKFIYKDNYTDNLNHIYQQLNQSKENSSLDQKEVERIYIKESERKRRQKS